MIIYNYSIVLIIIPPLKKNKQNKIHLYTKNWAYIGIKTLYF